MTKLNPTGTSLAYSTYLGGTGYGAVGAGIAVDSLTGDAYVTGYANTTDFPITNGAFQTTNYAAAAVDSDPDLFASNVLVTELNPTGRQLVYSTFVGGTTDDYGAAIALDPSGDAYVTGYTDSSDFPVAGNAFQPTNLAYANEASAGFVTEVNPTGSALVYSTFLSGSGIPPQNCGVDCTESGSGDSGSAIAVDGLGDAYVTGNAVSSNFPTTAGAYQTVNNAAGNTTPIGINAFITKLNPGGSQLLYSTYLGGNVQDLGYGIALDGLGGVYVAGQAASKNFPTTAGAYQTANAGGASDAFVAKLAIGEVEQQVNVPNVVGDTQAAATTAITGAGLTLGTVTTQSSPTVASGSVISESPTATTSVNSGSAVNLVVSSGPAQVAATPVFSPAASSFTSAQIVTITDTTAGAVIYYTTDGSTPTASSTVYTGPITVSATETIEAIAIAGGFTNSAVATADYIVVVIPPGYSLSANPPFLAIKSGSTGSTIITLTAMGGFTGTVNFSCGMLPPEVTCAFAPSSLTVASGSAAPTTTLTVGTTGTTAASLRNGPGGTLIPEIFAAMILLPLGFTRRILRARKAGAPWLTGLLLLATASLAAAGMLGLTGCAKNGPTATPGTYVVPIEVTSGGTTDRLSLAIVVE